MRYPVSIRTGGLALVAAALLALVLTGVHNSKFAGSRGGIGSSDGPLDSGTNGVEIVFSAPTRTPWFATAGTILLCSSQPDVTIEAVRPAAGSDIDSLEPRLRIFRIERRDPPHNGEPVIGGYGVPPRIGGLDDVEPSIMTGSFYAAAQQQVEVPACDDSTGLPGTDAVELLLTVRADSDGALLTGVEVDYVADGKRHGLSVPVNMLLCGRQQRDPDC